MNTFNFEKVILDLCSGTGSWSKPYLDAGYNVIQVDPVSTGLDVRLYQPPPNVYGILAAPPCTVFCKAGSHFKFHRGVSEVIEARSVVDACIRIAFVSKPKFFALENPSGWLSDILGSPTLNFQPCDFGDPWTKQTYIWGYFNHLALNPVEPTEGDRTNSHYGGRSAKTKTFRSKTPPGFALQFFLANP